MISIQQMLAPTAARKTTARRLTTISYDWTTSGIVKGMNPPLDIHATFPLFSLAMLC